MESKAIHRHCILVAILAFTCCRVSCQKFYTAAVYEHARQEDGSPTGVRTNLEYYERAARAANEQGADIILFPEYGLFPPVGRDEMKKYVELIPNPIEYRTNPCDEGDVYSERPIMYTLSCMAKINKIVVVANMGGKEDCAGESECPEDGVLNLNANVVFDQNGTLLARYYKEHLYFELGMDLPRVKQYPIFETSFGKFSTAICFDIIFRKMADISHLKDIDAVLFSTMWLDSFPFYVSIQWWQAWAMGNNATLLAANIQIPGYLSTGSGIFRGMDGPIVSAYNPDGISKLIVATVPKRNQRILSTSKIIAITKKDTKEWKDDGKDVPLICSYSILGKAENISTDYRCINENVSNYTLAKLTKTNDRLQVCNEGMCCKLVYVASDMSESFYLGVYNGTYTTYSHDRYFWAEENCFLARCDDYNGKPCSNFPMKSNTTFHKISMSANFTSKRIYPSLVSSGVKLVPVKNWSYAFKGNKPSIDFNSKSGVPILLATLKGRAYNRDPPYIR